MIAALYVEKGGVYFGLPDVDPWDEERDARLYAGPYPVVAHPPCGHWGRLRAFAKSCDRDCAPLAVDHVQQFGGVLEHPAGSLLWRAKGLPLPGEFPDEYGGETVEVDQVKWGHRCTKRTWLYLVRCNAKIALPPFPGAIATRSIQTRARGAAKVLKEVSHKERRATPLPFRDLLLEMARSCQASGGSPPAPSS